MSKFRKFQALWVIAGYIFSLCGGLPGMLVGSILVTAKKVLPGGQTAFAFDEQIRKHGKIILNLSSIILVVSILFFLNWFFLEKVLFGRRLK